jgi:transcriptional antiterminator
LIHSLNKFLILTHQKEWEKVRGETVEQRNKKQHLIPQCMTVNPGSSKSISLNYKFIGGFCFEFSIMEQNQVWEITPKTNMQDERLLVHVGYFQIKIFIDMKLDV